MQNHEPSAPGSIWSEELADGQLPKAPASSFPWDLVNSDDVDLAPRTPNADRVRVIVLSAIALAATSFVLGWTSGLNWPGLADTLGFGVPAQNETASETRPSAAITSAGITSAGINGVRKTTSRSTAASGISVRSPVSSQAGAHHSADLTGSVSPSARTNTSIAAREHLAKEHIVRENLAKENPEPAPLGPAPETRPTTIPGWTVIEVRDGAAVLEGPDGVRVARRGETIPGLGQVDSIVRWGNRLIVATTNGLISTP